MKDKFTVFMVIMISSGFSAWMFATLIADANDLNLKGAIVVFMYLWVGLMMLLAIINWLIEKYHQWKVDRQKCQ